MTSFRFRLQRVLDWRRTQLALEEAKLQQRAGTIAQLDRAREQLAGADLEAAAEVRACSPLEGRELAALAGFHRHVCEQQKKIAAHRVKCAEQMEEQRKKMLEARRRFRLLERLRDRRLAEWQTAANRELEDAAAEAHLARYAREHARDSGRGSARDPGPTPGRGQ